MIKEACAASIEDESADPVGDGHADADLARRLTNAANHPGRDPVSPDEREPPVEPDRQDDSPDDQDEEPPR